MRQYLNFMVNTRPLFLPGGMYKWPFNDPIYNFGFILIFPLISISLSTYIESVRIFQGTCDNNQTTGNKVDQSYMSCLEDGTKKIKFT